MTSREKTMTLVITEEIDKYFRDVVAKKISDQHGVLKQAIVMALKHYADGLMDGTIKPFEVAKVKRKNKALSYKDQDHSKEYTAHEHTIAWTNPQPNDNKSIVSQSITSVEALKQTSPYPMNNITPSALNSPFSSQLQSPSNVINNYDTKTPSYDEINEAKQYGVDGIKPSDEQKDQQPDTLDSDDITPVCATEPTEEQMEQEQVEHTETELSVMESEEPTEDPLNLKQYDGLTYNELLEKVNAITDLTNPDNIKIREYLCQRLTVMIEQANNSPQ